MPKIHENKCRVCGKHYIGYGILFCSRKCWNIEFLKVLKRRECSWKQKEIHFLKNNYRKMPVRELSIKMKRSKIGISHKAERLGLQKGYYKYRLSEKNKILTKELAYFLGATLGDGSIRYGDPKYTRIVLTVKDKDFALEYARCIKKQFGFEPQFKRYLIKRYEKPKSPRYVMYRVKLEYFDICKFIKYYDYNQIFKTNNKIKRRFLKGIFDAEGTIVLSKKGTVCYIGMSNDIKKICNWVSKLLKSFDIENKVVKIKEKRENRNDHFRVNILHGRENYIKFKKNINFSIKRKSERLNHIPYKKKRNYL